MFLRRVGFAHGAPFNHGIAVGSAKGSLAYFAPSQPRNQGEGPAAGLALPDLCFGVGFWHCWRKPAAGAGSDAHGFSGSGLISKSRCPMKVKLLLESQGNGGRARFKFNIFGNFRRKIKQGNGFGSRQKIKGGV